MKHRHLAECEGQSWPGTCNSLLQMPPRDWLDDWLSPLFHFTDFTPLWKRLPQIQPPLCPENDWSHLIARSESSKCHAEKNVCVLQHDLQDCLQYTRHQKTNWDLLHWSCDARSLAQTLERFGVRTLSKNLHHLWLWPWNTVKTWRSGDSAIVYCQENVAFYTHSVLCCGSNHQNRTNQPKINTE